MTDKGARVSRDFVTAGPMSHRVAMSVGHLVSGTQSAVDIKFAEDSWPQLLPQSCRY